MVERDDATITLLLDKGTLLEYRLDSAYIPAPVRDREIGIFIVRD